MVDRAEGDIERQRVAVALAEHPHPGQRLLEHDAAPAQLGVPSNKISCRMTADSGEKVNDGVGVCAGGRMTPCGMSRMSTNRGTARWVWSLVSNRCREASSCSTVELKLSAAALSRVEPIRPPPCRDGSGNAVSASALALQP